MKPVLLIFLLTLMSTTITFGQVKIGDNPQNIDPSSVLELESTSRVLVITRVNTLEMEAITPQRGGVVYNTDSECMHYYNGTSWINLCDATSFSLTNEPIENITSTISIVDNGTTINLEVAPNSIRSENIVDGGINGDDIQDNSIGESKLGADSVGADELRDNTVGATEIIDGSITPIDMANTIPNQVLTTDINGTVNWEDTSNLRGAVADEVSITGSGTAVDPLMLTDAITASILSNTTAITAHVSADNDTDNQNEVLTGAELDGNELVLTESGVERRVDLGPLNNAGTDNQNLNLNVNSLEITNGNTVNLAKYLDNTDEQRLTLSGNRISLTDGGFVDLPPGTVDTDEQQLTIAGNRISLTDGGFVDLPAGTVDTDNQAITGGAVVGNELRIDIEDGISGTIDISSLTATGTDSQNLTGATLSPTNILQIDIQNGNSTSVDLSALAGGGAGSTEEADGTTILGLGTPTDQFRVGSIGSTELTNGSVLLEDLNPNGANNGQVIKWDETANAGVGGWIVADDRTDGTGVPALTDGTILLGDGTDAPQERVISGDATLDNTGVLTIIEDAITLPKLAPGTVAGQLLQWNGTDWEFITEADINPTIVSADADQLLTVGTDTGALLINADIDATFATDAEVTAAIAASAALDLDIDPENEIELPDDSTATAGQILATNGAGTYTWVDDQTGTPTIVSTDADQLLTVGTDTGALLINANIDATFATDAEVVAAIAASAALDLDIDPNNEIELPDDATATSGQILATNGAGTYTWVDNNTASGTTGSIFFADTDGTSTENNDWLFWDNINNQLRIGPTNTTNTIFRVNGASRFQGTLNSNGSANTPSYRFNNDDDTGMYWNGLADQLGFSVGGLRALLLRETGTEGIEIIADGSLELTEQLFDETGNNGNEGNVLTATSTGTVWSEPVIFAMGKLTGATDVNVKGATISGGATAGNYIVEFDIARPDSDYIIQLTIAGENIIYVVNQTNTEFEIGLRTSSGAIVSPVPNWFFTVSDF